MFQNGLIHPSPSIFFYKHSNFGLEQEDDTKHIIFLTTPLL